MKSFIICIGNRFVPGDAAGLAVHARLEAMQPLPAGIELIEGGLAGLNLLPFFEQGGRVVLVDSVSGFTRPGDLVVLKGDDIAGRSDPGRFDHGAGLPYVLGMLPRVCEGELPKEITLVGLEGECTRETIERAAELSVAIAAHGVQGISR